MRTLDRRQFGGLLAAALVTAMHTRAFAQTPQASARARKVYERATVIDGCGGPGGFDPDLAPGAPLSAAMVADAQASGITAVNLTVVRQAGHRAHRRARHPPRSDGRGRRASRRACGQRVR